MPAEYENIPSRSFWTLSGSPTLLSHPGFLSIAKASGCTAEQALFKLAQDAGVTPLTGTTSVMHMGEDLAVHDVRLTRDGLQKEHELVSNLLVG
jgi:diketogulonate reductase-like aldo/keto reductase